MKEEFQKLSDVSESVVVEKFFLDKTEEALDADREAALEIAAQFDEFRRQARDGDADVFYAGFFATLSDLIKRHHEP